MKLKKGFYRRQEYWYFSDGKGRLAGPFDHMHRVEMDEWKHSEVELKGAELCEALKLLTPLETR